MWFFQIDVLYKVVLFDICIEVTLNYHHLRYFWAIAHEGGLTKAAVRLNVAQSALSIQLRRLEEDLGHPLFIRSNRTLTLSEAGRLALQYADSIFQSGDELMDTLQHRSRKSRQVLRIGTVATLAQLSVGVLEAAQAAKRRRTRIALRKFTGSYAATSKPLNRSGSVEPIS